MLVRLIWRIMICTGNIFADIETRTGMRTEPLAGGVMLCTSKVVLHINGTIFACGQSNALYEQGILHINGTIFADIIADRFQQRSVGPSSSQQPSPQPSAIVSLLYW